MATAAGAVGMMSLIAAPAANAATNGGTTTITGPNHVTPLTSGGSLTDFSFMLPQGAKCSGDTATNGYHVFSYLVPSSVDPATINYDPSGPVTPAGAPQPYYPLIDSSGSPFAASNTAIGTGQIVTVPSFNYAAFSVDGRNGTATLPAGSYNIGLACADTNGIGDKFFNAAVTFTATATDPAGFTWALTPGAATPEAPLAAALPLSAVVLVAGALLVARRRRMNASGLAA